MTNASILIKMAKIKKSKKTENGKGRLLKMSLFFVLFFIFLNVNLNVDFHTQKYFSATESRFVTFGEKVQADPTQMQGQGDGGNIEVNPKTEIKPPTLNKKIGGIIGGIGEFLLHALNLLLYGFFVVISKFVLLAAYIIDVCLDPSLFLEILKGEAIKKGWEAVRDFLNLAFILVLLYSGFCTVFQVEKYHIKKIVLMVVLMALLVNFSMPISKFIIDVSNVTMYYILNNAFPSSGGSKSVILTGLTNIHTLIDDNIHVSGAWEVTAQIITSIVFMFILGVTLFTLAILLLIRIVVLAVLVIFSPVGFVAAIFPSTKNFADSWWTQLFKQSFFGPIMIFQLYIGILIMQEQQTRFGGATKAGAISYSAVDSQSGFLPTALYFLIPIVIIWTGMIAAQKIGAMLANTVVGKATGLSKRAGLWAGKKFSGYNIAKRQWDAFAGARKKREEEKAKTRIGGRIGNLVNRVQDTAVGKIPIIGKQAKKRAEKMRISQNKEDIDKGAKDLIDQGEDVHTLGHTLNSDFSKKTSKEDQLDQAKRATAFKRQDYNEKREFIRSVVHNASPDDRDKLDNIINISADDIGLDSTSTDPAMIRKVTEYNKEQAEIQGHIASAKAGNILGPHEIDAITSFVNKQMGRKIKIGVEAKNKGIL